MTRPVGPTREAARRLNQPMFAPMSTNVAPGGDQLPERGRDLGFVAARPGHRVADRIVRRVDSYEKTLASVHGLTCERLSRRPFHLPAGELDAAQELRDQLAERYLPRSQAVAVVGQPVSVRLAPEQQPVARDYVTQRGAAVALSGRQGRLFGPPAAGTPRRHPDRGCVERPLDGQVRFDQ